MVAISGDHQGYANRSDKEVLEHVRLRSKISYQLPAFSQQLKAES